MKGLTKKDMALFVIQVLYHNLGITEDHWHVQELIKRKTKADLEDLYNLARKAFDSQMDLAKFV